ncbi:MAG: hypothetical protein ABI697_10380 [Devosia sp.]
MPRYFFHLRDGEDFVPDEEGSYFADLDGALEEARQSARDMLSEQLRAGEKLDGQSIEVSNDRGDLLERVTFKSVVDRLGPTVN